MKLKELKEQTTEELKSLNTDLEKEIFDLRAEWKQSGKCEKPHLIKAKKKTRARIKTILSQKENQ